MKGEKTVEDDELIESLKTLDVEYRAYMRTQDFMTTVPDDFPPVSPEVVARAEQQLGFELPPLLKRLYTEVGNGGFGPGIVGLEGGCPNDDDPELTLVELYHSYREYAVYMMECEPEEEPQPWPDRLLPVAGEGCNMIRCLDCSDPEMPVIRFDANYHPWASRFIPVHPSLRSMLEDWLNSLQRRWQS